jgi:hypothetical protein
VLSSRSKSLSKPTVDRRKGAKSKLVLIFKSSL